MSRFLIGFALLSAGLVSLSSLASASASEPFVVMTWNLEWFYDEYSGDNYSDLAKEKASPSRQLWDWRRDAVAESIARVSPSVVAVQEVENRRVLWYLTRALDRNHKQSYRELGIQGGDHFTEQDVGFLYRSPVDAIAMTQRMQTRQMRKSEQYFNLTKHLFAEFEVPVGDQATERVTVLNLHLRARAEAESLRKRQAALVHHWVGQAVARGENVIVLGDLNTEEMGDETVAQSDVGIMAGRSTPKSEDDLIDITLQVPAAERNTHLLGKQFDRILVSRSLIEDAPGRPDLVLQSVQVRPELAIRGERDGQQQHWERYWDIPPDQRDLSDHYPVIATFVGQ